MWPGKIVIEGEKMVEKSQWRRGQTVALALILSCVLYPGRVLSQQQTTPSVTVETAKAADFTLTARLPGRIKPSTISEVTAAGPPASSGNDCLKKAPVSRPVRFSTRSRMKPMLRRWSPAKANVAQAQASYDFALVDARRAGRHLPIMSARRRTAITRLQRETRRRPHFRWRGHS